MFERLQEINLNQWVRSKKRKPLIIRGARQVGKSTLVQSFAKKYPLKLFEINCELFPELEKVAKTLNIENILRECSFLINEEIS